MSLRFRMGVGVLSLAALAACSDDGNNDNVDSASTDGSSSSVETPSAISLNYLGRYASGIFDESAAEIPAYHAASQRVFVVNANKGAVDVLDMSRPNAPRLERELETSDIAKGTTVNSVAINANLLAVAVEAPNKTDNGWVALYDAQSLERLGLSRVGAQPDMVTFTPDGRYALVANEGEPSDDYQIDPEGSVGVIDISDPANPTTRLASFSAFNDRADELRADNVRIYGPNASVAQDLEPEYIGVSGDSRTAWVTLQENNALARVDIASATVTDILPLGYKDHGEAGNYLDASDKDGTIDISAHPGLSGMYQPDAISAYEANGQTWLVTANEGDARAWGEDNDDYWEDTEGDGGVGVCQGNPDLGFVEEIRGGDLFDDDGFIDQCGDIPPQLATLGGKDVTGALLNPDVFGSYCGATPGDPGNCREDDTLDRIQLTWTQGYQTDTDGNPVWYDANGNQTDSGSWLMYDRLYAFGARSFSIWSSDGELAWDSGDFIERFTADQTDETCGLGYLRNLTCATYFNSDNTDGNSFDKRSDNKGPEPEGVAIGQMGDKTFAFIALERMGGILVFDVSNPQSPKFQDYLNTREDWATDEDDLAENYAAYNPGDMGPEGLVFIPAKDSPNDQALLVVGNEVSGTTSVYAVESVSGS